MELRWLENKYRCDMGPQSHSQFTTKVDISLFIHLVDWEEDTSSSRMIQHIHNLLVNCLFYKVIRHINLASTM